MSDEELADEEKQVERFMTQQTAFRLTTDLIQRLDAVAAKWNAERPGIGISRADVVRALLERGLAYEEKKP